VELTPGDYRTGDGFLDLHRRPFPSPRGRVGGDRIRISVQGGRVAGLERDGKSLAGIWLDPPLVASFYGPELQERRPVTLEELPEDLILCVLAAEDAGFLEHAGLSIKGILRAAWANFQANAVRQGGSTLTQQLVKNLYLTHERRFVRKLREALLAVLLELRYDKRSILQTYLNEIYWGRSGRIDLMGVGAASWAYFGKPPAELELGESALLAGMIRSPARLSPADHPQAAAARRNEILARLAQLEWVEPERLRAASQEPVRTKSSPLVARRAPYFADAMVAELGQRYPAIELEDTGYVLHSTLHVIDQEAAEEALGWGVEALEAGWEKERRTARPLQAALVSLDPRDGAILAYVGGRNYAGSQFDRVSQAKRQAGSAFKPIVYAAAFERRVANPATFLEDAPYTVHLADRSWSPRNSDGEFHGWVTARTALEKSYNVPTARLAVDLMGMDPVVDMARRLGIGRNLRPLPALALGAMEVTPLELATVYSTFASGGIRPTPHGLRAVFDRQGREVAPTAPVPAPERVLEADVAFLVTQVLRGVIDRGTASRVRRDGLTDPMAGKTGTTNDRRDSWFAGYTPGRTTLVWVGYDDNTETRLSGARAAVPIWARFTLKVRPPGGYPGFRAPEGVILAWIDPRTGGLAHELCSERQPEYFLRDFVPEPACADDRLWRRRFEERDRPGRLRRWLDALRGRNGV
ncbi:MAG: PBP1A family penicillin-binding protein, partial [Holophagales bacterium]|nr:PBP1A family penicillin-binding protein [Holophagales bacterium]